MDNLAVTSGSMLCRVYATSSPENLGSCGFAGTVLTVGEGITRFKEGDRVLSVTFPTNPADKTAEYVLATQDLSCHIPQAMSFTQASSMGLEIATAGLALFQAPGLELPMMEGRDETVLISGGATPTGTMAIQLMRIAGYSPIVTCSPADNAICESFGAEACFDYQSSTCGADIRVHTDNNLKYVLDCVTDAVTMKMCYEAINSSSGGVYISLKPFDTATKYTRRDIHADWLMTASIVGQCVEIPGAYGRPSMTEHREFGKGLFAAAERWMQSGKIKYHPINVEQGGLEEVAENVDKLGVGHLHAKELVVPLLAY